MKTVLLILFSFFLFVISLIAQPEIIYLKNPSFEDYPRAERVPEGWRNCGFAGETAPDTHPSGAFDVIKHAADGATYLGLVTRDNDTWESIGQKLAVPMIAGQCYIFKLSLCRSELYVSASRSTGMGVNYTTPIKLKIWGGNYFCHKKEELGETEVIEQINWEEYTFTFHPTADYNYIMLEAFYEVPVLFTYNGNLLIDNASPIIPVICDSNWIEKYKTIFSATPNKYVHINDEDRDETAKNTVTVITTATKTGKRKPIYSKIPAIYYNSTLADAEKKLVLEKILHFIENHRFDKANIIIEENTKKEQKRQKKLLKQKLKELGVLEEEYLIILNKK